MCETRNANRSTRTEEGEEGRQDRRQDSERSVRPRGGGPRNGGRGGRDGGSRDGGRGARGPPGRQGGGTDEWVLTRRKPGNKENNNHEQ